MKPDLNEINNWKSAFLVEQGKEVQSKRLARDLSILELSRMIGVHRNTITAIEQGKHDYSSLISTNLFSALGARAVYITRNAELLELAADSATFEQTRDIIKMRPANQIMIIGKQIRQYRHSQNLTLAEAAAHCGLHPNSLWNLEHGLVVPSMFTLHRLYYCMGVQKLTACYDSLQLLG